MFWPLGMKDTFYVPPPEKYDRLAAVYRLENGKLQKRPLPDITTLQTRKFINASGDWNATASDMFAFYQMVLNGGTYHGVRILSQAAVEAMTTVQTSDLPTNRPAQGYGLGWQIVREPWSTMPFASIGSYWHGSGKGTLGFIDPKKDLVTVSLFQRLVVRGSTGESEQRAEVDAIRRMVATMAAAAVVD